MAAGGPRRNAGGARIGAGRPRLSDEEKARRKALRKAGLMPPGRVVKKAAPVDGAAGAAQAKAPKFAPAKAPKKVAEAAPPQLEERLQAPEVPPQPQAEASELTPLDYMLKVMRDERADAARRDRMALAAAQFMHQRRDTPLTAKGKKELQQDAAHELNRTGRFGTPPAPRLSVVSGGKKRMDWSTACPDWKERIVAGRSLVPCDPLFPQEAKESLDYFNALRIADAPGSPTMGEACRPWFSDFVASVFGAYDAEVGRRLITEFFLLISKKNMKSTGAAGIMLTALLRNWRTSAEYLILAPTIEVANNSFWPARDAIRMDPELSELLKVQEHTRTITHRVTEATLKIVAADNDVVSGKKATGVLIDELWLFGKRPDAENMLREACGGLASRPEGFVIQLSTQSDEPPAGVFRQRLQYARKVRDGEIVDPKFLPVLYEFPPEMIEARKHLDPKHFYITNPNLGASVDKEFLDREFSKAQQGGEESLRGFLAKHLNVQIGVAMRADRWAGADFWEKQGRELSLEEVLERSDVIEVGIDGGGLDDMLGVSVLGRDMKTQDWLHVGRAWLQPVALERRKENADRYRDFERDGDLVIVSRPRQDVDEVAELVVRVMSTGKLDRVGVDPVGIATIFQALLDLGIEKENIVGVPQGWRMSGATKDCERRLSEGTLLHGGRPLMAWCVGNAKVELRGNATTVTKQISGLGKIDPLIALFIAASLLAVAPAPQVITSDYELLTA